MNDKQPRRNPFECFTHKWKVFDALLRGPIKSTEISAMGILDPRGVIYQIRQGLPPDAEILSDPLNRDRTLWQYRLVSKGEQLPLL